MMSTRTQVGIVLAAVMVGGRGLHAWWAHEHQLIPDFALYTQGGVGLFPSPLGRAIGALGPNVLGTASAVAGGLSVALVGYLARSALAAWLFGLLPLTLWLSFASVDGIGLALILAAFGSSSAVLAGVAAAVHLQLTPFAMAYLVVRGGWKSTAAAMGLLAIVVPAMLMTAFSGLVYQALDLPGMVRHGLIGCWPAVLTVGLVVLVSARRGVVLGSTFLAAAECAVQHHANPRYFLLPVALACSTLKPWREWVRAPGERALLRPLWDRLVRRLQWAHVRVPALRRALGP